MIEKVWSIPVYDKISYLCDPFTLPLHEVVSKVILHHKVVKSLRIRILIMRTLRLCIFAVFIIIIPFDTTSRGRGTLNSILKHPSGGGVIIKHYGTTIQPEPESAGTVS